MKVLRAALMMMPFAACGHDGHTAIAPPDVLPDVPSTTATAIHISSDLAPTLVAFREEVSGAWQPATMLTPTTFEADVHGPYEIAVQCSDPANRLFATWEVAQTPDDGHDVAVLCAAFASPVLHAVTGHMVQAGEIAFSDDGATSDTANWDFSLSVASGSFDLIAVTAADVAMRRAITVGGDLALAPAIDLTHEGSPLVATHFTVTNATLTESLVASVNLDNPTLFDARIYRGPLATGMVVPDAMLVATDAQSASIQATDGGKFRAFRKPVHAGDTAAYTLPAPNDVQFTVESGQLVASWGALPPFDHVRHLRERGVVDVEQPRSRGHPGVHRRDRDHAPRARDRHPGLRRDAGHRPHRPVHARELRPVDHQRRDQHDLARRAGQRRVHGPQGARSATRRARHAVPVVRLPDERAQQLDRRRDAARVRRAGRREHGQAVVRRPARGRAHRHHRHRDQPRGPRDRYAAARGGRPRVGRRDVSSR
jgi:hypothetical protein